MLNLAKDLAHLLTNTAINLLFLYKCCCKQPQLVNLEKLLQFFGFLDKLQCPQKGFGHLRLEQIPLTNTDLIGQLL